MVMSETEYIVKRLREAHPYSAQYLADPILLVKAADEIDRLRRENVELRNLLWTPENEDFAAGVVREAGHQVARWGSNHDAGKEPHDWFWLIGYLAGKALKSAMSGDTEKAKHHCISTAAVCANWHQRIAGTETTFRPGLGPDRQETKPPSDREES